LHHALHVKSSCQYLVEHKARSINQRYVDAFSLGAGLAQYTTRYVNLQSEFDPVLCLVASRNIRCMERETTQRGSNWTYFYIDAVLPSDTTQFVVLARATADARTFANVSSTAFPGEAPAYTVMERFYHEGPCSPP
jgi:hypothetical protein